MRWIIQTWVNKQEKGLPALGISNNNITSVTNADMIYDVI